MGTLGEKSGFLGPDVGFSLLIPLKQGNLGFRIEA